MSYNDSSNFLQHQHSSPVKPMTKELDNFLLGNNSQHAKSVREPSQSENDEESYSPSTIKHSHLFEEAKESKVEPPPQIEQQVQPNQVTPVQQQPIQPIFVQQMSLQQIQQMQYLNYLKESVPCVEYLFGFCMEGNKDCIYLHPKRPDGSQNTLPQYQDNECLPQEYLEKVQKYFDDGQLEENLLQHLIKKFTLNLGPGVFGGQPGPEQLDLQSMLGVHSSNRHFSEVYSNADSFTQKSGFGGPNFSSSKLDSRKESFQNRMSMQASNRGYSEVMSSNPGEYDHTHQSQVDQFDIRSNCASSRVSDQQTEVHS